MTDAWYRDLDATTRRRTAFGSFKELCRNKPTLQPGPAPAREEVEDFRKLREAYRLVTGRNAA